MSAALAITAAAPAHVTSLVTEAGLEVWHVRSDFVPLIAVAFSFEGGSSQDAPGRGGTAQMLSRLLDEGAGPYGSDAFQERLAARAIELSFTAGPDSLSGSLKTLVEHADEAFALLRFALAAPRLDPDAIERVRGQMLAGLRYHANDPGTVATRLFSSEAFPDHPYGRPVGGTLDSVPAITREDLLHLHGAVVDHASVRVAVVGDLSAEDVRRRIDGVFADLGRGTGATAAPPIRMSGRGTRVVSDIDVPQSVIRFGVEGVSWRDPDFTAAYVLNHVLGGGAFTSRLFQEVREKRGLAYSVGTSLVSYRGTAMTWGYTATKNERVPECLDVIASEFRQLAADGPSDDELDKAKAYLTGSYALGFDTSTKIAHQLVQLAFEGLGVAYLERRNALVAAVTQADLRRAAERTIGDGTMLIAIAGRPAGM